MPYPKTEERLVTETLHGQTITDRYRWLEQGDAADVKAWTAEQAAYTREVLSGYSGRRAIRARLAELRHLPDLDLPHGHSGTLIYQRRDPGQEHTVLYAERHGERVVVADANALGAGDPMHVDWATVSADGRYVLYGVSQHGNEWSVLHVFDWQTGQTLEDRIPRARHASIAFPKDAGGFFYTRYPLPGEVQGNDEFYNVTVFYHRLGTPHSDDLRLFASPDDKRAIPRLHLSPDDGTLIISLSYGWTREVLYQLDVSDDISALQDAKLLLDLGEANIHPFWDGNRLLALTNAENPDGRLVEISLTDGHMHDLVQAAPGNPMIAAEKTDRYIAVHGLSEAVSELRFYSLDGTLLKTLTMPDLAGIVGLSSTDEAVFWGFEGFNHPRTIERLSDLNQAPELWAQAGPPVDDILVSREWAVSKDGTRVPIFVVHRRDFRKTGETPLVLSGYGGFNVPMLPPYSASVRAWVERGGVYALAQMRGGSEFGETWHRSGMRQNKQNVFDDFEAAARHLIETGYTDSAHLGVTGRSNGGLLTGTFVTQHPNLARAVIIGVPLLDMLRYHHMLIADLLTQEYGSPDKADEFPWLKTYSPYHHVQDGTHYPAVLLFTSEEDSRVDPMHARKMTALLQKATGSQEPVLLRVAAKAGHGVGKSVDQWLDEEADIWTFLSHHLHLPV